MDSGEDPTESSESNPRPNSNPGQPRRRQQQYQEQQAQVDVFGNSLTNKQLVLLGCGITSLGTFLPWVTVSSAFGSVSKSGIAGDGIFSFVAILAAAVIVLISDWQGNGAGATFILGLISIPIPLLYLLNPTVGVSTNELILVQRGLGLPITLVGVALVTWGSWRRYRVLQRRRERRSRQRQRQQQNH